MAKVDPQQVMALRRLTDLPLSMCREALIEAGGDLAAVVRKLRQSPSCGWHAADAEVAAVLAAHGYSAPESEATPVTVAEVLGFRRHIMGEPAVIEGHLIVTDLFCYLAAGEYDAVGILVHEPRLEARLLESVPVMGGSMVLFSGSASVDGVLRVPTGLPMFPALLHSVRTVVYRHRDWEPVRLEFAEPSAAADPGRMQISGTRRSPRGRGS